MWNGARLTRNCVVVLALVALIVLVNQLRGLNFALETLGMSVDYNLLALVLMAVALGTDALSLSVGIGLRGVTGGDVLRVSSIIGLFHVLMPLIGLALGRALGHYIGEVAGLLGAAVVGFIGLRMIWGCLRDRECFSSRWTLCGVPLLLLALSVSMDALSVGFSLGTFGYDIVVSALVFGLFGFGMTAAGLLFGHRLGRWLGMKAELLGGAVLLVLAIHMAGERWF